MKKVVTPEYTVALSYPLARFHVHQGETNDCGPYCVAIVVNGLYGALLVHADVLAGELDRRGLPERFPGWLTPPWSLVAILRRLGLRARWRVGVRLTRLFDNLCADRISIVVLGEPLRFVGRQWGGWAHYKILNTWEPERELGFVDPATSHPSGMTWQPLAEFRRQWTWLGRQVIEVWRA